MVQTRHVLCILTSKCAFRHSRVHFFNISTHKSGPNTSCFVHFDFQMCLSPQPRAIFSTSARTKVVQTRHVLCILTSKCAFRHSGVQFFDIRTSKSALGMRCFVHFHFQMCLSPQWRAIFRHLNFEKCSRTLSFLTFSLPNVLFATVTYNLKVL